MRLTALPEGLGTEACAADERPALDGTPVTGLQVGILGAQGEAGIDDKVHDGLVLKVDGDSVVLRRW